MKLPFFNESLNAFLAVAAERSFSAAAKKLGVTQSAVTKAVARLEKELEVELFDRGCRPVMLTEEAMLLLKDVLACQHRKLFKNPRCQAGWNKIVPFGFS